jgi:serine phosphatase RsbU (regulator of sigma subunit)
LATLNIASVDMVSRTLVLSRNSHCPTYLLDRAGLKILDEPSRPVGIYRNTRPVVTELPLEAPTLAIIFTDGLLSAGTRQGATLDIPQLLQEVCPDGFAPAQTVADALFEAAYELDQGRPVDDISVLVISILNETQSTNSRHLHLRFPL